MLVRIYCRLVVFFWQSFGEITGNGAVASNRTLPVLICHQRLQVPLPVEQFLAMICPGTVAPKGDHATVELSRS